MWGRRPVNRGGGRLVKPCAPGAGPSQVLSDRIKRQVDDAGFAAFKQQSGHFMRGDLGARAYHDQARGQRVWAWGHPSALPAGRPHAASPPPATTPAPRGPKLA
jgi:hypothetical protein